MLSRNDEPFPIEVARDLLGILRLQWMATPADEVIRRQKLAAMCTSLRIAIELAVETEVGSVGQRAAWTRAKAVCVQLAEVVDHMTMAQPLLRAGEARLRRRVG